VMRSTRDIHDWRHLCLDLPTEYSYRTGRSIVPPHDSTEPIGTAKWLDEAELRMRSLREDAWTKGEFNRFVFLHDRKWRWPALKTVSASLGASRLLAQLFRDVWVDSEDIYRERRIVRMLVHLIHGFESHLLSPEDRDRFESMPEPLKIYRGAKPWNRHGMSWTVDLDRAVYFATHHYFDGAACILPPSELGFVMEKTVSKKKILFYTNGCDEDEVVLPRFERGKKSPEGILQVAAYAGAEAFS